MPLKFTYVLCRSTGEPISEIANVQGRKLTQQLNLPTSAEVVLNMDDDEYLEAVVERLPRLKVYRSSTETEILENPAVTRRLVFYGSLLFEGIREDAKSGLATLQFQDPSWVLKYRFISVDQTFTAVDQGTILWQEISVMNGTLTPFYETWIRQGGTTTGRLRDRTYARGKNVAELFDEMTKVDGGPDWYIDPVDGYLTDTRVMGNLNVANQRGVTRPNAQFIYGAPLTDGEPAGLPSNVENMVRTRAQVITNPINVGGVIDPSIGIMITYGAINSASAYGGFQSWTVTPEVSLIQTLIDKSNGELAERQDPRPIIGIEGPTPEAPQPFIDYTLGDTVYATCRRGGMQFSQQTVRVHGIDIAVDQNGEPQTSLTLAGVY
jgi:hypothetical protein